MEKLSSVVFILQVPLFFFQVGSIIRVSENDLRAIGLFLIFFFFSLGGKFAGTYLSLTLFSPPLAPWGVYFQLTEC